MNKSYTLVWNQATGCWNVASEGTRRRSKSGRGKALVVAGASLLGLFCQAPAFALPSGATVVSGDAGFQTSTDGRHMVIDQQSHKLITNWNEFSVRADERVSFHQPGQDAVALNRVIGRNGSDIQGRIDANGKVFLVNPNGVVFGKSAQVNVGGLVASTLDLADRDFLAGNYQFSGDSGATVSNAGSLQASEGGSIALLGARVSNDGVIQAQLGDVALGAGQGINLNFDGDGLLNLQVDKGSVDALAHNGGLIRADGGQVLMSARSADSLLKTVVNNQGTLEARTLRSAEGRIVLDGGEQGTVRVAGKQDASAIGGGNGGLVLNQGANVEIQRTAQVDTHADQGATGTWRILSHEVSVAAVGQANAAGDGSGQVHVAQGPAGANASDSNGVTIVQQQPAVDLAAGANGTSAVQSQSGAQHRLGREWHQRRAEPEQPQHRLGRQWRDCRAEPERCQYRFGRKWHHRCAKPEWRKYRFRREWHQRRAEPERPQHRLGRQWRHNRTEPERCQHRPRRQRNRCRPDPDSPQPEPRRQWLQHRPGPDATRYRRRRRQCACHAGPDRR
ncbi:Large exoprotein [Pseudomonas aeruginosa]|nr:Large exoprotein [Pseudomonas aeruginosa]